MATHFEKYALKLAEDKSSVGDGDYTQKEVNEDGNDEATQSSGSQVRVQQAVQTGDGEGTQPSQESGSQDSRELQRGDGPRLDEGGVQQEVKGGVEDGKEENAKTEDGYGSEVRQEAGQGVSVQGSSRNETQVVDESGKVRSRPKTHFEKYAEVHPKKTIGEELSTSEGRTALAASLLEGGAELAGGSIAAIIASPLAIAAGPAAPVVEGLAFPVGAELTKKIVVEPVEKMLGIDEAIKRAKEESPEATSLGGILGIVPFGVKSVANLTKVGEEFGAKEVAKRVGKAALGGAIFEPARVVAETGLKEAGIKEDEVAPMTAGSVAMSAAQIGLLGGLGAREQILREKGAKILENAGLTETAKAAKILLTDDGIKQKRSVETDKRVANLFESADKLVDLKDTKNAERVIKKIEQETKSFPADDALQKLRDVKIAEIKNKLEAAKDQQAKDKQAVSDAQGVGAEKGKPYEPKPPTEKDPVVKRRIDLAQRHITFGNAERATKAVDRLEADVAQYPAVEEVQNQRLQKIQELRDRIKEVSSKKFDEQRDTRLAEAWKKVESFQTGTKEHTDAFNEYIKISEEKPKSDGAPKVESGGDGERLDHAAVQLIHPETGAKKTFFARNHDSALDKAYEEGYISEADLDKFSGNKNAKTRNKDNFGYITNKGRFVTRKEGFEIAKKADQLLRDKFAFEGKDGVDLHSHEVALDKHGFIGKIDTDKYEGMSVANVLKEFSQNKEIHPSLRELSKLILKNKNKSISWDRIATTEKETLKKYGGAAMAGEGWVWLPKGSKINARTVIHEVMHSYVARQIDDHVGGVDKVGKEYIDHIKTESANMPPELKNIVDLYLHSIEKKGLSEYINQHANGSYKDAEGLYDYGFHNLHEFISEAFSNPDFQNTLKGIQAPKSSKSVFNKLVESIQKIFKIPTGSVAHELMKSTFELSKRPVDLDVGPQSLDEYVNMYQDPQAAMSKKILSSLKMFPDMEGRGEVEDVISGKIDEPKTEAGRSAFQRFLEKTGLFREDLRAAGLKTGKDYAKNAINSFKDAMEGVEDMLAGETIPNLTKAGCKASATQFAYAKNCTHDVIMGLLAKAFPKDFANQKKLKDMTSIMAKDNILAGLDEAVAEYTKSKEERDRLIELYDSGNAPKGTLGEIKDLEDKMESLSASAQHIRDSHDIKQYEEDVLATKGTDIEQMIESYKKNVQPAIDELYEKHSKSENVAQEIQGKHFGARINLISSKESERLRDFYDPTKIAPRFNVVNYRNPDVKRYDPNPREGIYDPNFSDDITMVLTSSFASRINEVSKMDFYRDMVDKGVAKIVSRGTDVSDINGKRVVRMEAIMPQKDPTTGKVTMKNMDMYVREDCFNEINQLIDIDTKPIQKGGWQNAVTKIQVIGIADGVSHMKGLHAIVQQAFGRDTRMKDFMSKLPIFGSVNAIVEINNYVKKVHNPDAETLQKLAFLSQKVGLRPRYEQENGLQILPMHKWLHEWDTAVRLMMHDYFDNLVKRGHVEDTMDARISFINKIGEYNNRLQPRWIAQLRQSGTSPFLIGGTTMTRAAIGAALGRKGFEAKTTKIAAEYHAMQMAGLVMAGTLPAIINLATTGNAGGRAGTPIGVIDFGESFDTEDGRRRSFDLFQLMSIRRGMRATGINSALEGFRQGMSPDLMFKNIGNDLATTYMHPFVGPGIGLLYQTATGKRIDLRSGWSENYDSRKIGGPLQYVENFRVGLKEQNPLVYGVAGRLGLEVPMKAMGVDFPVEEGSSAVRDVFHKEGWRVNTLYGRIAQTAFDAIASPVAGATGGKLTSTPALKLSAQFGKKEQYTPQQDKRYAYRQEIFDAYKAGRKSEAMALYAQGLREGVLVEADKKILAGKFKEPDILVQRTRRLKTADDAVEVFRVATPEEQDKIYRIVMMKVRGTTTKNASEKLEQSKLVKKLVKKGSRFYTG